MCCHTFPAVVLEAILSKEDAHFAPNLPLTTHSPKPQKSAQGGFTGWGAKIGFKSDFSAEALSQTPPVIQPLYHYPGNISYSSI